jgi:RNA polymerase sigma-70 factor (ECF subfamily)
MSNEALTAELMRLRPLLLRVARRWWGGASAEADDAVQETTVRLWQLRGRLDQIGSLEAFAVRTVKNVCVSQRRSQRFVELSETSGPLEPADGASPQTLLEMSEDECRLERAVAALPASEGRVCRLSRDRGMGVAEIAQATGLTERSVSALLSKARRRLWETLKQK